MLDRARQPSEAQIVNVGDILTRVREVAQPRLARHKIRLQASVAGSLPPVKADATQLEMAIFNLVTNALDAMPEGGRLAIRIFRVDAELRISFADSGPGVPVELQERIFNPFFTTKPSGTGLGLAKSFAILESHGGRIEYADAPGGGAMFTLVLPIYRNGTP